jgi:hypothetical protein
VFRGSKIILPGSAGVPPAVLDVPSKTKTLRLCVRKGFPDNGSHSLKGNPGIRLCKFDRSKGIRPGMQGKCARLRSLHDIPMICRRKTQAFRLSAKGFRSSLKGFCRNLKVRRDRLKGRPQNQNAFIRRDAGLEQIKVTAQRLQRQIRRRQTIFQTNQISLRLLTA